MHEQSPECAEASGHADAEDSLRIKKQPSGLPARRLLFGFPAGVTILCSTFSPEGARQRLRLLSALPNIAPAARILTIDAISILKRAENNAKYGINFALFSFL